MVEVGRRRQRRLHLRHRPHPGSVPGGRGREERANIAYLNNQKAQFVTIENTFAEPSDTAIQHQMGELWGAFADVANNPNDRAIRTALIEQGHTVVDGIRSAYNSLGAQ